MLLRNHAIRENPVLELPLKTSLAAARGNATPVFARSTTATCMGYAPDAVAGASQVLLTCAVNEARFQGARRISEGVWDNKLADGTLIPDSQITLLREEASTNLVKESSWVTSDATFIGGVITVSGSFPQIINPFTPEAGSRAYVFSVEVKNGTCAGVTIRLTSASTATRVNINLSTNAVVSTFNLGSLLVADAGDGYVRITGRTVASVSGVTDISIWCGLYDGGICGVGSTLLYRRASLEDVTAKSYKGPSSYIPTTTAAVTRAADALSYTSAPFSNTQGTALIDIEAADWATVAGQYLGDGTEAVMAGRGAFTNLLTYSEDFSNAIWITAIAGTGITATKTPNYGTAPDGTTTACRVVLDKGVGTTTNDRADLIYNISFPTLTHLSSVWIKTTDGTTKQVAIQNSTGASVVAATGIWSRVSTNSATANTFAIRLRGGYGTSNTADLLIWHPQFENLENNVIKLPGPYIPTTTAAASYTPSGLVATDGTSLAAGPSGTPSGRMKFAVTWGNGQMQCFANGQAGAVQSYDGSFNLDSFIVGSGFEGGMRNLRLFKSRLPAAKIQRLTS
jgi:hypothetical protein